MDVIQHPIITWGRVMRDQTGETDQAQATTHPLDHVVWNALVGAQARFAEGDDRARRYPAAITPFAATADDTPGSWQSLLGLLGPDGRAALTTPDQIQVPRAFAVLRRDTVEQMVLDPAALPDLAFETGIETLSAADAPAMLQLTALTQPGPFGPRTIELGQYIGIRRDGTLAAMAGERMRLTGFTEISAVCVHPDHRGHGYAADLILTLGRSIAGRSETPFLHVFTSNTPAIALYRKLGFVQRRQLHLTVIARA